MAGLNLITGTGKQTVEEMKRDLFTAQSDIEHLDSDYVELESRVSALETDIKDVKKPTVLSKDISKIQFGPQNTDEIVRTIESPVFRLSNSTTADYLAGGGTQFKPTNFDGTKEAGYSPLRVVIPEGTQHFSIKYEGKSNEYEVTVYVYDPEVLGYVIKEVKNHYTVMRSGLYDNLGLFNEGLVNIKGNFPITLNLSTVTPEGTTVSYGGDANSLIGNYINA